jgi:hypothetical protein
MIWLLAHPRLTWPFLWHHLLSWFHPRLRTLKRQSLQLSFSCSRPLPRSLWPNHLILVAAGPPPHNHWTRPCTSNLNEVHPVPSSVNELHPIWSLLFPVLPTALRCLPGMGYALGQGQPVPHPNHQTSKVPRTAVGKPGPNGVSCDSGWIGRRLHWTWSLGQFFFLHFYIFLHFDIFGVLGFLFCFAISKKESVHNIINCILLSIACRL